MFTFCRHVSAEIMLLLLFLYTNLILLFTDSYIFMTHRIQWALIIKDSLWNYTFGKKIKRCELITKRKRELLQCVSMCKIKQLTFPLFCKSTANYCYKIAITFLPPVLHSSWYIPITIQMLWKYITKIIIFFLVVAKA